MNKYQKRNLALFLASLILPIISLIFIIFSISTSFLGSFQHFRLFHFAALIGILAAGFLGLAIGLFIIRRMLRYIKWDEIFDVLLKFALKILQKFHIPLAMIGLTIISIHIYIFIHLGFKWTIGYIFGALAAIDLLILVLSGILRIFNKGFTSHKVLGILLLILTVLHVILVK